VKSKAEFYFLNSYGHNTAPSIRQINDALFQEHARCVTVPQRGPNQLMTVEGNRVAANDRRVKPRASIGAVERVALSTGGSTVSVVSSGARAVRL
jgi:hypothetical protein